jgi:hypothetical protein
VFNFSDYSERLLYSIGTRSYVFFRSKTKEKKSRVRCSCTQTNSIDMFSFVLTFARSLVTYVPSQTSSRSSPKRPEPSDENQRFLLIPPGTKPTPNQNPSRMSPPPSPPSSPAKAAPLDEQPRRRAWPLRRGARAVHPCSPGRVASVADHAGEVTTKRMEAGGRRHPPFACAADGSRRPTRRRLDVPVEAVTDVFTASRY